MKEYKVVKEFACAKKGDILTYDSEADAYVVEENKNGKVRYIGIDENSADSLVRQGYMIAFETEDEECGCNCCEKLAAVSEIVDKLITEYHNNYESTMKLAEEGKIQPCVRVEAETVYFNLNKVLNKIKGIINE